MSIRPISQDNVPAGEEALTDGTPRRVVREQSMTTTSLLWELRSLLPIASCMGLANGLLLQNLPYIFLDFFARSYTNLPPSKIQCEVDPTQPYCQAALATSTWWTTALSVLSCLVPFFIAPVLGPISDSVGRWPVLVACSICQVIPGVALVLHCYCGLSLYPVLILLPLTDVPVTSTILAACVDVVECPHSRAAAFGMLFSATEIATCVGTLMATLLSIHDCVSAALAAWLLSSFFVYFGMQETLPRLLRRPLNIAHALIPGTGLQILFRNPLFRRVTFCVVGPSFAGAALARVSSAYLLAFLAWTRQAAIILSVVSQITIILWLGLGLKKINHYVEEIGVLAVSISSGLWHCLLFLPVCQIWQVWLLSALFTGPHALCYPAAAALKSRIADEQEQGEIQGALAAAKYLAEGVSRVAFGSVTALVVQQATAERAFGLPMPAVGFDALFVAAAAVEGSALLALVALPELLRNYRPNCLVQSKSPLYKGLLEPGESDAPWDL